MKYFAYGSNMDPARMSAREVRFSQRVRAILRGYRLKFNKVEYRNPGEGYANIVQEEGGLVEGVLYDIPDSDLSKLDGVEGYPAHYDRIAVSVQLDDGQEIEAVTYVAQPDSIRDGLKPTREYLSHLLAAKDVLSNSYYRKLQSQETLD
ncbi:MAG: gamma-glutamylcyclotransferase family protein [Candidatus Saccharicenans sp.]|uniref:gamma-glutamylcyclotransferase family protein n=1 Tax=Candidatus Saccharicenans sp. TaxID=2819258 RepID=UPI00404983B9